MRFELAIFWRGGRGFLQAVFLSLAFVGISPSIDAEAGETFPITVFERGCLETLPLFNGASDVFRSHGLKRIGDALYKSDDRLVLASVLKGDHNSLSCMVRAPLNSITALAAPLSGAVERAIGDRSWNIQSDEGGEPIWGYHQNGYGIVILLLSEPPLGPILHVAATPSDGSK